MLFELYYHNFTTHAAEDTHVISGYGRLAEQDERTFSDLQHPCQTTNGHPDVTHQVLQRYQMKLTVQETDLFVAEHTALQNKALQLPFLKGKVSQDMQDLIDTLAELTIHLYATEDQRSPRSILRIYNISVFMECWEHSCSTQPKSCQMECYSSSTTTILPHMLLKTHM